MWVLGVAFYVALLHLHLSEHQAQREVTAGYIDSLPTAVRAAFLGPGGDFSTPVGYVNVELLSWLAPIVLIAFAVSIAARSLAGEEERRHAQPAAGPHRWAAAPGAAEVRGHADRRRRSSEPPSVSRSSLRHGSLARRSAPDSSRRRCCASRCWASPWAA